MNAVRSTARDGPMGSSAVRHSLPRHRTRQYVGNAMQHYAPAILAFLAEPLRFLLTFTDPDLLLITPGVHSIESPCKRGLYVHSLTQVGKELVKRIVPNRIEVRLRLHLFRQH